MSLIFDEPGLEVDEIQPEGEPPRLEFSSRYGVLALREVERLRDVLTEWLDGR